MKIPSRLSDEIMALHPELYPYASPFSLWLRLPFQGVLITWAYWYTRPSRHACP